MVKNASQFICQQCGTIHARWSGQCEGCGAWNTLIEESVDLTPKGLKPQNTGTKKNTAITYVALDNIAPTQPRQLVGIAELDRVLGGGLVAGSAILIGGDPGIGKSTLLLQAMGSLTNSGQEIAYISGEESIAQIQLRAHRLGITSAGIKLAAANSVRDIIANMHADIMVIDSIQTMYIDSIEAAPGTVSQVRACSDILIKYAKKRNISLWLVGHVTKDGQIAGPRVLEHMVDTVLYFEGDRSHHYRILRSVKNRFGATDEIGVFEMCEKGLNEVSNPSSVFLGDAGITPVSGSAIFAGLEGSRPMLMEIQALVAPSSMATPRRAVVGWDSARLSMLLAVLEGRAGLQFSDKEVYLNVAGGMRISEPAADLAVAAALVSALKDTALPNAAVWAGEIGLSGEIRTVSRTDLRLKEAEKLGFNSAYVSQHSHDDLLTTKALGIIPLSHVQDLITAICQRT